MQQLGVRKQVSKNLSGSVEMFEEIKKKGFQVMMLHHAEAILAHDMADAVADLEKVLLAVQIPAEELVRGGGGEGVLTKWLRRALADERGWTKHSFEIKKIIDGVVKECITHEIDHVRRFPAGTVALEIEWNNKDPFFDRDLENFKRLHADGVISIGAIITRGVSLQESLRDFVAAFARKNGIISPQALSEYYYPTKRQLELTTNTQSRRGNLKKDGPMPSFRTNLVKLLRTGESLRTESSEELGIHVLCC